MSKQTDIATKIGCTLVSRKRNGNLVAKQTYYFHHGLTEEKLWLKVKTVFPNAEMIDSGDHFHAFVGGAKTGSPQDSFVWVEFKLQPVKEDDKLLPLDTECPGIRP